MMETWTTIGSEVSQGRKEEGSYGAMGGNKSHLVGHSIELMRRGWSSGNNTVARTAVMSWHSCWREERNFLSMFPPDPSLSDMYES